MTNSRIHQLDTNLIAQEIDVLDGHLLGDGSVFKSGKDRINCIYGHTCKHKEYLEWMVYATGFLAGQKVLPASFFDKRTQKTYHKYHLKSKSSEIFTQARQRWYPCGKKILPDDVTINSRSLLRFYLDDGSICRGAAYLATHDFCFEDVNILRAKIASFCNMKVSIHQAGNEQFKLYVGRRNFRDFLSIIGSCPVQCYSYKWGE